MVIVKVKVINLSQLSTMIGHEHLSTSSWPSKEPNMTDMKGFGAFDKQSIYWRLTQIAVFTSVEKNGLNDKLVISCKSVQRIFLDVILVFFWLSVLSWDITCGCWDWNQTLFVGCLKKSMEPRHIFCVAVL